MAKRADLDAVTPGVRRYARGLTGMPEIADDLVQDAILAALRSTGLGRGAALRRKLYAIVTDFNRMRVAALPDANDFGLETKGEVLPFERSAGFRAGSLERTGLGGMTLAEREALLLVAVEEFSYAEAADIAGVSRSALIARLARARGQSLRVASPVERPARASLKVVS